MKYLYMFTVTIAIVSTFFISLQFSYSASLKGIRPSTGSGYLKSNSSLLGTFSTGNENVRGSYAFGGGSRSYAGFGGAKNGARGAIDGVPDISPNGSSKGNTFTTTVAAETARVGQIYNGSYSIYKGYMSFNTTAIPYDAIIKSATLTLYGKEKNIRDGITFDIGIYESDWEEPLWNVEWGSIIGSEHGSISSDQFKVDGQANEITIIRAHDIIKPCAITKITLVSSRTRDEAQDIDGAEYIVYYTSDTANTDLRPQLDVEWIGADPSIVPSLSFTGETIEVSAITGVDGDVDESADFKLEAVYPNLINQGNNHLTFRVRYIYPVDNNSDAPPSISQVWVDLNYDSSDQNNDGHIDSDEADFDDPGEKIDMHKADPEDDDWTNGVIYQAEVDVLGNGVQPVVFQFVFEDSGSTRARASVGNASKIMQIQPLQTSDGSDSNACFMSIL
ncbi:MAG: DNRLRE domain-containing protein [bacterium]